MNLSERNDPNVPVKLYWVDRGGSQKKIPAGVAFYEEEQGEYRLKIDMYPKVRYYLKAITTNEDKIYFRVEVLVDTYVVPQRRVIGEGFCHPKLDRTVFMEIGPHSKYLAMEY